MDNDTVREYTGEPGCFKFRSHHGGTGYKSAYTTSSLTLTNWYLGTKKAKNWQARRLIGIAFSSSLASEVQKLNITHSKKKATARVTRARVLGGNTSTTTTLSGDARAHLPSVPTSMFKSVTVTASEAKAREAKRFAQATESYKRQERSM